MNGSNKKKVQTSSIYPPYNSLKSYPDTERAKYSGVLMLSYYQICIFISGRSKFNMDWGLFFFFKIGLTLNCWLLCLLGCLTNNIKVQ